MSSEQSPIIVIKKIKKGKKEHHGGSWKIAYADFVTAMMAFFMLLWLLSLLNKYQLQGVSAYFQKPLSDIFVGSKNAEHYKAPPKKQIIQKNKAMNADAMIKATPKDLLNEDTKDAEKNKMDQQDKTKDNGKKDNKQDSQEKHSKSQRHELMEMQRIKKNLEIALKNNASLNQFKDNLSFEVVDDGIKVSLHDSKNNPMFSLGQANFHNYAKHIIVWLSGEFNHVPKKIIITGHTDAWQYNDKANYTNWELSTDRANAVRRLLIADGMDPAKIIRVEGAADVSLQDVQNGDSPINRRVEIIILTDEAANRIKNQ
ncbi:flagellar motor protein MotB [Legionella sp. CNM-4043-24]|uniref:flagellar motor protein MotB n=1 Tax=Legionella sp. CNM-4043-24 TaxID=3421646 RepID=UPI00403B087D